MVEMNRSLLEGNEVLEICLRLPRLVLKYYIFNNIIITDDHFNISYLNTSNVLMLQVKDGIISEASNGLKYLGIEKGMSLKLAFVLLKEKI